jgi:hypothetical protein
VNQSNPSNPPTAAISRAELLAAGSILLVGLALRLLGAARWSLWEDEGTSLVFAHDPTRPFPSHFPLYFYLLAAWQSLVGPGVGAARVLSGLLGTASLAAAWALCRRWFGPRAALFSLLLMSVSLGHLFWSQSIRYYILVLLVQTISIWLFYEGFEKDRKLYLVLASAGLLAGVFTHFSAVLLFPVFVAHVALCIVRRESGGAYRWSGYLWFGIPFGLASAIFLWQYVDFRRDLTFLVTQSESTRLSDLFLRVAVYQGVAPLALAAAGLLLAARRRLSRELQLAALVAGLPLAELTVLALRNSVIVLWYQGFFAIVGLCALAGFCLAAIQDRFGAAAGRALAALAVAASVPFLLGYYTWMHGDRPRWREAAETITQAAGPVELDAQSRVVTTVPWVVAYYLEIPVAKIMGHSQVLPFEKFWREAGLRPAECWFVVEPAVLTEEQRGWLEANTTRRAEFPAHSGPKDRTIWVCRLQSATCALDVARKEAE